MFHQPFFICLLIFILTPGQGWVLLQLRNNFSFRQTMRFKPPPPNSEIGWRIEFRPCELQFTDFENAAICCFVVLLTRVILSYKYNILIPISKVDENMKRAQKRDAIFNQKFYFRRNITDR